MKIMKQSPVTGKLNTLDLPVTLDQIRAWSEGLHPAVAFPELDKLQLEFITTGVAPTDWC